MSDYNSSLPIRTENAGDAIVKVADATTPSQQLAVDSSGRVTTKLNDGTGNSVTSQISGAQRALDVGINVSGVQVDPRQVRALTSADVVTANQGTAALTASAWPFKLTDGTNIASITAAGEIKASITQPLPTGSNVIGSVNQGTSPWTVKDQADGPVSPGAAASFSLLAGAVYNSAAPTLTTGQQASLQADASGNLKVNLAAALPTGANTIGSVTQASGPWTQNLTQVGGAAVALGQTTMSASIPVVIASNQSAVPVNGSVSVTGTVAVTQSTSPWVVAGNVADATTDSGNSVKVGGVYDSALPTYTTGQRGHLEIDVNGRLITTIGNALPTGANTIGNVNIQSNGTILTNTAGALNVNISSGSVTTGVADKTAFTYGTTVFSSAGGVFQDTSPTLTAGQQGIVRLTTNRAFHINIRDAAGNEKLGSSLSAASIPVVIASDQAAIPASQSGTWTVQPGNTANTTPWLTTANQGTANTTANAWPLKVTDGTNVAAVKAASTAAIAADPSLVVTISPNTPLPAGSNSIGFVQADTRDGSGNQITSSAGGAHRALDVAILNGTAPVDVTNPLPVTISSVVPGTPIQNYNTFASLAAAGTNNHDYTVTAAKTLSLGRIWAAASGKLKVEIQVETGVATGVFNTKFVGFNSTSSPNIDIVVYTPTQVAAGVRVRVIRTNLDKASMDVYSTVEGSES